MQHILLFHKEVNRREKQHQDFYQLEHIALDLARVKADDLSRKCVLRSDHPNKIISQLLKNKGCTITVHELKYNYFVEELGDFSCMRATKDDNEYSTHHRRISLMLVAKQGSNPVIQIRYLSPIPLQECIETVSHVHLGINSWRYIISG